MNSRALLASLAAALALAGCVSSHGLHPRGHLTETDALRTERTYAGPLSPAAWPREDWWNGLGDARLDELIREGLASSPDLQVAAARARQADAAVLAAAAERLPDIGLNADVTRSRLSRVDDPASAGERYSTLRGLAVQGGYTFDLWGGQRDAWEAALGRARAGEVDQQAARLTLATDIARAYNDLGLAHTNLAIAEQDLKRTRDMLDLSQRRVAAGLDSEYQLQQTQSLEAASQAALTGAKQQVRSARIRLAVLLGQGPDRGDELPKPTLIAPAAVSLPPQLPAELVGRRPDLVAARWRVEAAAKDIDATKTEFYPNLNLNLAAGVKSLLGDAMLAAPSRYFNLGPALSLPIFDGGRRRADLAAADADYDLAVATYNQTLVRALGDVGDLITRLRAFDEQVLQQQRARDIARSSYDIALRRYGEGIGSYLDSLTVEQQLLQAERQLASVEAQRIDSAMLLMQALGGGFQPSITPLAAPAADRTH